MKFLLSIVLVLASAATQAESLTLTPLWETKGLLVPESVLVVGAKSEGYLLVSQIDGVPNEMDGTGSIAKISLDGKIIKQDWLTGLNAPKGMATFNGKLIVADLHAVVIADIASAKIEQRIEVPDSVFLNDIAVNTEGDIFVSDTRTNKVHRIKNAKPEVYLTDVKAANGLTFARGELYVAGGAVLWKVAADKTLMKVIEGFEENADGVEMIGTNQFIVSCWVGVVYHIDGNKLHKVLDTREQKKNTADIGWNPNQKIVYVPTFNSGSVVAYSLTSDLSPLTSESH